jgi:hypothetical protein
MSAILATQEAEIRRIVVQGQTGQKVQESLSQSMTGCFVISTSQTNTNRRILM